MSVWTQRATQDTSTPRRMSLPMSLVDDRALRARSLRRGAWLVIVAAVLVFAGLAATGALAGRYALAGFAIVAAAALAATRIGQTGARISPVLAASERGGDPLHAIVSGLPDPVIALDRDGRVVALNEPARVLAPALRHGEPVTLALRMPELTEAIDRACTRGEQQRVEYSERVPLDRWFEAVAMPVKRTPDARSPDLVLLTFRDLTPLRRVEEMRADFVANASHELRTPLAALSGFIETLQGPAREDVKARERFLAIMQEQARRMARLIDDLLSLSRIELNAHRRPDAPVDLIPIVRQVVDGLQTLARDRGVTIEIAADDALMVLGDRDELVRLFENLVENALKYGAPGKRVDVKLSRGTAANGQAEAVASVRDYGPGIAPEHMPRLTERFYRVDVRESRAQGGTGLGLALVKHILNRHRGRLSIESAPGEGATFRVHLPIAMPRPSP
jgi:two-component system phosphate regulon sensor histidine kinase PhoR